MFREEVHDAPRNSLHGEVALTMPVSWQLIGYGLLAILVATLAFLFLGPYARVETVAGIRRA